MSDHQYSVGDRFPLQFVWQVPEGDYVRAVFEVEVLFLDANLEKYLVRLDRLLAGRQESVSGEMRPEEALLAEYWQHVARLPGKKVSVAWEVDDGRALHMKFETLTWEHPFFTRFDAIPD